MTTQFTFNPTQCQLVWAADYLSGFPRRGRPLQLRHLGLEFYGLRDCLYLGGTSQTLLPLHKTEGPANAPGGANALPFIFLESCPYSANEQHLANQAAAALEQLEQGTELIELDEAAPFYPPGAENLWHWMTESLPKLLALESIGYQGHYIIPPFSGQSVPEQSLALLGIAPERLKPGNAAYLVKNLMLPQRLSGFNLVENMPLCRLTRQRILEAVGTEPGTKRCYLRRVGARRVLNEDELLEVISDFGFETMLPEDMTLAEQWRYLSNAECLLAAHGAGSAHSLLLPERAAFVEMFGNRYVSYNNLHAVRLLRLRYYPLVQDLDVTAAPGGPGEPLDYFQYLLDGIKADLCVDARHLRVVLEGMF